MSIQSWFNQIWYDRAAPPWWLVPLSLVYGAVSGSRRFLYAKRVRRATRIPRPVVVVGNVSVGGTGKTPLVCWLVAHLIERGYRPGIVTRGLWRFVDDSTAHFGDRRSDAGRRRIGVVGPGAPARRWPLGATGRRAAHLLVSAGCDVIVSDDGLQHYALARDCEVVVIRRRPPLRQRLAVAGRTAARETPARLKAADAVVVNGGRALLRGALSMRLEAKNAVALVGGAVQPLTALAGQSIHAVAGIGNPERFFNMLRSRGIEVAGRPLADHARLTARDVEFGDAKPVLMTEKDAVKCAGFAGVHHWYVPVTASFEGGEANSLLEIILRKITNREQQPQGSVDG